MLKKGQGKQLDLESKVIGKFGLGSRNERGNMLLDLCIGNNLAIANTLFHQHPRRLYTWTGPGGKVRNQIDYILVKQCWRSSIKNAKTLPGADIGSDHQLLIADIRLKLKRIVRTDRKVQRFDLMNIDNKYKIETRNRFEALLIREEEMTQEELWEDTEDIIMTTAKKYIPMKKKRRSSPWLSQETTDLTDERRLLKEAGLQHSKMYSTLSNEIQAAARRDKNTHLNQLCEEIEEFSSKNNSRSLFKAVKDLTNRSTARLAVVKDENGKILTEDEEIKERWRTYCETLNASREDEASVEIDTHEAEPDILFSEIVNAINHLKTNKAPDIDEIPGELLKNLDETGMKVIWHLCRKVWSSGTWPEDWKKSVFLTIPKKGDASECKKQPYDCPYPTCKQDTVAHTE